MATEVQANKMLNVYASSSCIIPQQIVFYELELLAHKYLTVNNITIVPRHRNKQCINWGKNKNNMINFILNYIYINNDSFGQ